jgi:mRNA-degrading endonuclease YafQ of YafQ-DinJ toxin-antitoxin module
MEVIVTRQFEKDVEKELNKPMQLKLALLIEVLQQASSLDAVANVKKLKGYKKPIVYEWANTASASL